MVQEQKNRSSILFLIKYPRRTLEARLEQFLSGWCFNSFPGMAVVLSIEELLNRM